MSKGYWMVSVDITDPDLYPQYIAANKVALDKYGARFLARGGRSDLREGEGATRCVIVEFDSYETAVACYDSPEYRAATALRQRASRAAIFAIIEGVGA